MSPKRRPSRTQTRSKGAVTAAPLLNEIRQLIEAARTQVSQAVNAGLTMLYWHVGERIRKEILSQQRAEYGEKVIPALAEQLVADYGQGFAEKNLRRMIQFAEVFPDAQIVVSLIRQLTWTHFVALIPIDDPLRRDFYAEMCRIERWSTRTLRAKIDGMLYERTAISKKPQQLIRTELDHLRAADQLSPDLVFRDPYVLDFLGLKDTFSEHDLEQAILRELETFLLELGTDFSFVARQQRMTIDDRDYFLDLLFFHRGLRRLVAIELKLGAFQAADKGQMELYLRWLERHERRSSEEHPIGLILCAGRTSEHVEILQLHQSGIRVAEYLTELPERKLLERKLHDAIRHARARLEQREDKDA